ncbi:MAG: OsmC family protein [Candidatus Limnocylindrales bacterium]
MSEAHAATRYEVRGETAPGGDGRLMVRASTIAFDGSAQTGDVLPGPADLLAAALAACILKNVERFSQILPFRYHRASVDVAVQREEPPPRIVRARYTLRIETDEPDRRAELLHRNIRTFGTITNTLARSGDLQGEIVAVRTSGDGAPARGLRQDGPT